MRKTGILMSNQALLRQVKIWKLLCDNSEDHMSSATCKEPGKCKVSDITITTLKNQVILQNPGKNQTDPKTLLK